MVTAVASLRSVTVAFSTAAPLGSCTMPVTRDVVPCAKAVTVVASTKASAEIMERTGRPVFMASSSHTVVWL
jgi:hypothetical protein